jgi:hypothetical protein
MLAKAEGDGYMLSAFVSRVFGLFGREMTEAAVNAGTRQGQHKTRLTLKLPPRQILVCNEKPLLTESPFVNCVYIGANNKGYWNNYHTSLQFKDFIHALMLCSCIRTVKGMLAKQHGALSALQMSQSYGGTQPIMRDMALSEENHGYLSK